MLNRWYKLHSKSGQKEKERGEIQVSLQFTCNNMTASMFDLSMKDKPRTPFGKLKDKMKGKKKYDMESASAIVPSSVGRLDSDEEDHGKEPGDKKSKPKSFFLKGKLRKTSLTGSNTSLGSENAIGAANNAGITILLPEGMKKPSQRNSSLTSDSFVKNEGSPRLTHKRAFSDEASQVNSLPQPKAIDSLKPKNSPISKSSLCINGSHVYTEDPAPKTLLSALEKSSPVSRSLQNIAKKSEENAHTESAPSQPENTKWRSDGSENASRRGDPKWTLPSISMQEDAKASTSVGFNKHDNKAKAEDNYMEIKPVQIATPMIFSGETKEKHQDDAKKDDKKSKMSLFHHGSGKSDSASKSLGEKVGLTATQSASPQVVSGHDERSKTSGWFGSKDTKDPTQKPSFHSGSPATAEAAESISPFEDYCPSASTNSQERKEDNEGSAPDNSTVSQGFKPFQDLNPFAASLTSEWDESFDSFATSRLKQEVNCPRPSASLTSEDILKVSCAGPCDDSLNISWSGSSEKVVQELDIKENEWGEMKRTKLQSVDELPVTPESCSEATAVQITETILPRTKPKVHIPTSFLDENDKPKVLQITSARLRPLPETKGQVAFTLEDGINAPEGRNTLNENKLYKYAPPSLGVLKETNHLTGLPKSTQRTSLETPVKVVSEKPENISAIPSQILKAQMTESLPVTVHQRISEVEINLNRVSDWSFRKQEAAIDYTTVNHVLETSTLEPQSSVMSEDAYNKHSNFAEVNIASPLETEALEKEGDVKRDSGNGLETSSQMSMLPPKPPRCFTSFAFEGKDAKTELDKQTSNQDNEERGKGEKQVESPKEKVEEQNIMTNRERVSLVTPDPPVFEAVIEVKSERRSSISEDTKSTCNLEEQDNELKRQATSNRENMLDVNEATEAEQFKTCLSKFSLDRLDLLSAEDNSNKLDVFEHHLNSDLIDDDQSKCIKLDISGQRKDLQINFLQSTSLVISGKEGIPEKLDANRKKNDESSLFFWSALEEQQQLPMKHTFEQDQHYYNKLEEIISEDLRSSAVLKNNCLYSDKHEEGDYPKTQISKTHGQTTEHTIYSPSVSVDSVLEIEQQNKGHGDELVNKSGLSLNQKSELSDGTVVDCKNAEFWRLESDLGELGCNKGDALTPVNPFVPADGAPLSSQNNPFVERTLSISSTHSASPDISFQEDLCFKDLHRKAAPHGPRAHNFLEDRLFTSPFLHDGRPLASSTPSLVVAESHKLSNFPSPVISCATYGPPALTAEAANLSSSSSSHSPPSSGVKASVLKVLPQETQPAEKLSLQQRISPHPVKPMSTTISESPSEKKQKSLTTALSSGLEKLKTVTTGSVQPVVPSVHGKKEHEGLKDPSLPDQAARYYHLTHDELIHMLLQRERELDTKEEHLKELENYIDQLLVRIMDEAPALLQVPLEHKKRKQ
ncbi:rab11 family-interacting protein 5 isoform X2 [Rhinatrema bivittatum]|uniref:rab11 family-interacting protein 5 isoform X2 n=1 Tax=Rhinatrema bivittatum TaxID=194408 RepID=UPI001128D71C|nr:rab11 family-interacting protein 5 isoform X2 [Rhinatrema bivittatum]